MMLNPQYFATGQSVGNMYPQRGGVEYCALCKNPCSLVKIWMGRDNSGDLFACSPGCNQNWLRTHRAPAQSQTLAPSAPQGPSSQSIEQAFAQLPLGVQQQLLTQLLGQSAPQQQQQLAQLQPQFPYPSGGAGGPPFSGMQGAFTGPFLQSYPQQMPSHTPQSFPQAQLARLQPISAPKKRKKNKPNRRDKVKQQKTQPAADNRPKQERPSSERDPRRRDQQKPTQEKEKVEKIVDTPKPAPPPQPELQIIVIDTNCLIEHLSELLRLKKYEYITLLIPLVVIHELDGLKKDTGDLGFKARIALKAVFDALQENQPRVKKWMRGQTSYEVIGEEHLVQQRNNDDAILNCTLYFNRFVAPNRTLLMTNDTALSLKAVMNNVAVKNVQAFLSTLPSETASGQPASPPQAIASTEEELKMELVPARLESTSSLWVIQNSVAGLPNNLWNNILGYLPPKMLARCAAINRTMYELVSSDSLWRTSIRNTFLDIHDVLIPKDRAAKAWYLYWRHKTLTL